MTQSMQMPSTQSTIPTLRQRKRGLARDVVLDAAGRLLKDNPTADFSMRELARQAGVGFVTPFNHFGSKSAIMQALSSRLIAKMALRFSAQKRAGDAAARVLSMGHISVDLLLEQPQVSKAVVGSLGVENESPSDVRRQSEAIWSLALGEFDGFVPKTHALARSVAAQQLAVAFRGCLSFWTAGELSNDALGPAFGAGASMILAGFVGPQRRSQLLQQVRPLL